MVNNVADFIDNLREIRESYTLDNLKLSMEADGLDIDTNMDLINPYVETVKGLGSLVDINILRELAAADRTEIREATDIVFDIIKNATEILLEKEKEADPASVVVDGAVLMAAQAIQGLCENYFYVMLRLVQNAGVDDAVLASFKDACAKAANLGDDALRRALEKPLQKIASLIAPDQAKVES